MDFILIYLLLINATGFLLMLIDKYKARKNLWRIPEAMLMFVSLIGGSLGSLLGMKIIRHKTMHLKFTLGIPLILAFQIILAVFVYAYLQ